MQWLSLLMLPVKAQALVGSQRVMSSSQSHVKVSGGSPGRTRGCHEPKTQVTFWGRAGLREFVLLLTTFTSPNPGGQDDAESRGRGFS